MDEESDKQKAIGTFAGNPCEVLLLRTKDHVEDKLGTSLNGKVWAVTRLTVIGRSHSDFVSYLRQCFSLSQD